MASNEGSDPNKNNKKKGSSLNSAVTAAPMSQPTPYGVMPKLPAEDDKVDWMRTTVEVKAYFRRFIGFVTALLELPPEDPDDRPTHIESLGQAFNTVYSLVVEMCMPNETAMMQVYAHAQADEDQYPSTLWNMLEVRFT